MSKKIQLYSLATPNGQKVSIALEEMGLEYDSHTIDITKGEQFTPEFMAINPNSKIPSIVDPTGNNGEAFPVMESGAILVYLADKTGLFLSKEPVQRSKTLQWLFFQMGGIGPMFGQFGHFFKYAKDTCEHPYPKERYTNEAKRLLTVLEKQLENNSYISGEEITIADFSIVPWVICLDVHYKGAEQLELSQFTNVNKWVDKVSKREAFQRGMTVCPFEG